MEEFNPGHGTCPTAARASNVIRSRERALLRVKACHASRGHPTVLSTDRCCAPSSAAAPSAHARVRDAQAVVCLPAGWASSRLRHQPLSMRAGGHTPAGSPLPPPRAGRETLPGWAADAAGQPAGPMDPAAGKSSFTWHRPLGASGLAAPAAPETPPPQGRPSPRPAAPARTAAAVAWAPSCGSGTLTPGSCGSACRSWAWRGWWPMGEPVGGRGRDGLCREVPGLDISQARACVCARAVQRGTRALDSWQRGSAAAEAPGPGRRCPATPRPRAHTRPSPRPLPSPWQAVQHLVLLLRLHGRVVLHRAA